MGKDEVLISVERHPCLVRLDSGSLELRGDVRHYVTSGSTETTEMFAVEIKPCEGQRWEVTVRNQGGKR